MELRSHRKTIPTHLSFRALLQRELLERCRGNPNFSLRSFARYLKVEPSSLSQIMNGKRPLTEKMRRRLGAALGLSTDEIEQIPLNEDSQPHLDPFQTQTLDSFALISDWYHYAILELTHVDGFKSEPSWVSQRLGISVLEVSDAIERLLRLGLLKKGSRGRWQDTSENGKLTHLTPQASSLAARHYQAQLLELSKRAVQEVPLAERNHSSATFCFDPDDLPAAIQRLSEMRRAFAHEFQPKKKAKEVYQLQISLFPLTQKPKKKENL